MIALTNTARQLELDLASASSVALDIVVTFNDIRYADQTKNVGTTLSSSNGVTDVIITAAPPSGVLRVIESISVCNRDNTATETVRVYYDESGTESDIIQADLSGGDQLYYDDNNGWKALNSLGSLKQTVVVSGSINSFETIAVSGQSNVVADSSTDTLTLANGAGIAITTTAGTDTVTIAASGISTAEIAAGGTFTLATEQASTAGTAIDFTGIPSGTKMIVVQFVGVSTNGTSILLVQLGDAGGIEATGYTGGISDATGAAQSAVGFPINTASVAAQTNEGSIVLTLEDSSDNTWTEHGVILVSNVNVNMSAGSKATSAVLTQVRITTVNGTDAFDAGAINIMYK